MVDLFQTLASAPAELVAMVGDALESRAKDPGQQAILESYIMDLEITPGSVLVELGSGTGPVCRRFAEIDNISRVIGIEPAPVLIETAQDLAQGNPKLEFQVASGEQTGLPDGLADIVVLHTLLSHVADQQAILAEAIRLLKPSGQLAVCDADFSKISVAIGDADPLQACVDIWVAGNVTDQWLSPRLPGLLKSMGLQIQSFKGHNRVDVTGTSTGPLWINMGADALVQEGRITAEMAEALKAECQNRIKAGTFYAALPFITTVAIRS